MTGNAPLQGTAVTACVTADGKFNMIYTATDNSIWSPYSTCNSAITDADAVGILISAGLPDPSQYIEISVNPNGAAAIAEVSNPTGAWAGKQ